MSAVKRHPTDAVILAALQKSGISQANYPLVFEGLKGELTQKELAAKYGVVQSAVSQTLNLARRRIKENLPARIWVDFEAGGRLPISLVRKLGAFAIKLDASQDDEVKREVLKVIDVALLEAGALLETAPQLKGLEHDPHAE
jgi:hypothetical protein